MPTAPVPLRLPIRPVRGPEGGGKPSSAASGSGLGSLRDGLHSGGRRLTSGGAGPTGHRPAPGGLLQPNASPGGAGSQRRRVLGAPGAGGSGRAAQGPRFAGGRRAARGGVEGPSSAGTAGVPDSADLLVPPVRAPVADGLDERHGLDPEGSDRGGGSAPDHLRAFDRGPVPSGTPGRGRPDRCRAAVGGADAAVGGLREWRRALPGSQGSLAPSDRASHRLLRAHAAGGRLLLRRGQGRGLLPVHHPAHPGAAGGACQRRAGAAEQAWHRGGGGGSGGVRTHAQQRPAGGSGDPGADGVVVAGAPAPSAGGQRRHPGHHRRSHGCDGAVPARQGGPGDPTADDRLHTGPRCRLPTVGKPAGLRQRPGARGLEAGLPTRQRRPDQGLPDLQQHLPRHAPQPVPLRVGAGPGGVPPPLRHRIPRAYRQPVALRRRPDQHRRAVPLHLRGLELPGRPGPADSGLRQRRRRQPLAPAAAAAAGGGHRRAGHRGHAGSGNLDVGNGTERGRVHLRRAARVGGDLRTRDPAVGDAPDRGAHRHTVPLHGARHHGGADRPRRPAGHRPIHLGADTVK